MTNLLNVDSNNEALCKKYLTEELAAKLHRMAYATGGNPIIRAQDVNSDAIKTLNVREIADDWCMVSYLWDKKDSTSLVEIPLKVGYVNDQCKIVYITPIESDTQYGDEWLSCFENVASYKIDSSSGKSLVESFYKVYLATYCSMCGDLNAKLQSLRLSNLSHTALEQFKKAEQEYLQDTFEGYDLLVTNFDFDSMWFKSLKVLPLDTDNYQVTYQAGKYTHQLNIQTTYQDGRYWISAITGVQ
ncbi:hypothetical protein [uncultured Bacteroides sp.]|uniref:hypothetical protein n=1 Tax=uncultured Bacteroides sp. TaxID=162156 RepID=UPI00338EAEF9